MRTYLHRRQPARERREREERGRRRRRLRMGLSGAVEWWDEWQLRILVLGSLFVQYMLFFSSMMRRCALPSWLRLFIWLAYLGGDALAIYALATLFNRHKQQQERLAAGLEVLWAPVLLIHLGGQHMMTAYSIEDNELWMRNTVTAVSQVVVALYVFCKSWSGSGSGSGGEKRLLQAAILLFVVGIFRSIQKPLALRNASISNMVDAFSRSTRKDQRITFCWKMLCGCTWDWYFGTNKTREEAEEKDIPLEEFVQEAIKNLPELASDQKQAEILDKSSLNVNFYRSLVDISPPYSSRIKNLHLSMCLDYKNANKMSINNLNQMFVYLYTKLFFITGMDVCCLRLCLPFLTLASAILFSTNHKYKDYNQTDVKATSILFWCTALLDFLSVFLGTLFVVAPLADNVPQYNLLSFCARKKRPTILMKLATLVWCKDYVNMHCYTQQALRSSLLQVTELIHGYIRDGWKGYIHDDASYRRFNSRRGQWALRNRRHLRWSLNMSFDRSILIWHIATDLCFHHQSATPLGQACAVRSRVISNYMAYLLFLRPEMLMPGSRIGTFTVACEDVELLLGGEHELDDETALAQGILSWAQARQPPLLDDANMVGSLVPMACKLAKALMELREVERWEVIQGVWVEMLCYSASRCRGYLHAKNMGEGMEPLSHVWFLLSIMGMETFADRFQKPEPSEGQDDGEGKAPENKINIFV
ncbi:hypothetical protein CFC21_110834 [Triticum aestivum]|uniref:DUF4220 domain-containing protein n=2 Tax=Triticum aestivum TaxID=4565 RepID=A0A9R1MNQ9_WHEAT|nr:hypothetical protein CFC21_110834 [Triticum aestivum]